MSRWDLPPSWEWVTAGEIAEIVGGGTPPASEPANFAEDGFPWLTPADLSGYQEEFISRGSRGLTETGLAESSAKKLPAGAVLFSSRAPIGYCVVAANPISTNQGFKSLVLRGGINPRFVRHYLLASREYAESLASGSTFKELSGGRMAEMEIPIAPLAEQERVVAKVAALQARSRLARESLEAIPPLLEQFRQSVLAAAFRGDLTAEWRADHAGTASSDTLLEQIRTERRQRWHQGNRATRRYQEPTSVDSSGLPDLPPSWRWAAADELSWDITVGHVGPMSDQYVDDGIPFLRSQNVRKNRVNRQDLKYIPPAFHEQLAKSRLSPGDLVVVRSGDPGTSCVIPGDLPVANCADLVIARLLSGVNPELVSYYINSAFAKQLIRDVQVGVAQQHFNVGSMRELAIPVIPQAEQVEIVRLVAAAERVVDTLQARIAEQLRALPRIDESILAKAFRGELVPQDPADEPASVLLERIRAERVVEGVRKTRRAPRGAPSSGVQ